MAENADMKVDAAMLDELAQLSLSLVRRFHEKALAAEDDERALRLAAACHRAERSVRQSIALKHKLGREARLGVYLERRAAREDALDRGRHRQIELEHTLKRMIWTEAEAPEAERLDGELSGLLANAKFFEGFADPPLADHIARLRVDLGLAPSAHLREGGDLTPSARPRAGGDPSGASTCAAEPPPGSTWIPAFAGMSGGAAVGQSGEPAPATSAHPHGCGNPTPSARPRAGGDPSGASPCAAEPPPGSTWIPAFAGMSGGAAGAHPPNSS